MLQAFSNHLGFELDKVLLWRLLIVEVEFCSFELFDLLRLFFVFFRRFFFIFTLEIDDAAALLAEEFVFFRFLEYFLLHFGNVLTSLIVRILVFVHIPGDNVHWSRLDVFLDA